MAEIPNDQKDSMTSQEPAKDNIDLLIVKHRPEIDVVLDVLARGDSQDRAEVIGKYNLNNNELREHYADLFRKDDQMAKQDEKIRNKVGALGVGTLLTTAVLTFVGRKKLFTDNKFLQATYIVLSSIGLSTLSVLAGFSLFGGKLRKESAELVRESNKALVRELAVAMENRDITTTIEPVVAANEVASDAKLPHVEPRNPSYAVAAMTAKTTQADARTLA